MLYVVNLTTAFRMQNTESKQTTVPIFASFILEKAEEVLRTEEKKRYEEMLKSVGGDKDKVCGASFHGDDERSFFMYTDCRSYYGIIQQCAFGSEDEKEEADPPVMTDEDRLREAYCDKEPVGYVSLTNTIGVEVMEIINGINDEIVWRYGKSDDTAEYGKSTLDYEDINAGVLDAEQDLQEFFLVGEMKIYLSDVVRTGY
jgi:hypothetical protein